MAFPPPSPPSSRQAATPLPARRDPLRASRYRVYQVWRSLLARPLDDEDRAILAKTLPPGGRDLFDAMTLNDQRHSLTVYRALRDRGCADADLLAAALLHDSGKGSGRTPFVVRPLVVLLRALAPRALAWLAREPRPWFRRPFYFAYRHADIGAELAKQAGLNERVVTLIRTHHQPDGPAAELHAVDEEV